ncbi:MAG: low molecular weight protein arginine phosphatase [Candidatus Eisenbacteria sp.]|nr:low molecular weight protein arginine phosphatase [Candidatus Eisenbacteria bacterium]
MAFHVLFVCTGNTCRSPMAEGLLRRLVQEHFPGQVEVSSAGTAGLEGLPASEFAMDVARENGVDLEGFHSSALNCRRIREADLILVMSPSHLEVVQKEEPEAADRIHLLREFGGTASGADSAVPDPIGASIEVYRQSYQRIDDAIRGVLPRLQDLLGSTDSLDYS